MELSGPHPENPFFLYAKSPTPPFFFRVETESFITHPFKPRIDPARIDKVDGATPPQLPVASVCPRKVIFFILKYRGIGFFQKGDGPAGLLLGPDFCSSRTGPRGAPRGPGGPWGPLGEPWGPLGAPGPGPPGPGPYFGPWALRGPWAPRYR